MLFRTLLHLLLPIAEVQRIGGEDACRLDPRRIARRIAYVPQVQRLPFAFTVRDTVLMGRSAALGPFAAPGAEGHRRTDAALAQLGIADLAWRDMLQLSGGQQRIVLIARALGQGAPSMVLNEPTASLDLANRQRIGR